MPSDTTILRPVSCLIAGLTVVLLSCVTPAKAQTADDALRFSQRHAAIGGAPLIGMGVRGFGGVGVYGALHSNPAGLGYINRSELAISLDALDVNNTSSSGSAGFSSDAYKVNSIHSGIGNLSYVHNVPTQRGSMVFGFGFGEVQSFQRDMEFAGSNNLSTISTSFLPFDDEYTLTEDGGLDQLNDLPFAAFNAGIIEYFPDLEALGEYPFLEAAIPGTVIDQQGTVRDGGQLYEGGAGMAVEVAEDVMLGASLNFMFGDYSFDSSFEEIDTNHQNGFEDYNVLDDGNLLEGFDRLTYAQRLESELVGVNLRVGVSAQLNRFLRVGAAVESPTWVYIEESYGASYSTEFDDGGVLSYGNRADDVGNGFFRVLHEYSLARWCRLACRFRPVYPCWRC